MSRTALETTINAAFDARDGVTAATKGEVRDAVESALALLDQGEARVAEVARMLGGEHLSGTTLAHAKEMLGMRG